MSFAAGNHERCLAIACRLLPVDTTVTQEQAKQLQRPRVSRTVTIIRNNEKGGGVR